MNANDVEIVHREVGYRGFFRVDRYWLRHRLHGGGWSEILMREVLERGHSVAVLPYDPDRDRIVLIDQFRIGAMSAGWNPWVTEIVAGMVGEGETPEAVAVREAAEETGCSVTHLTKICDYLSSPGGASEVVSIFCGRVDASRASGVHGQKDESEDILVYAVPVDEALARLRAGEINNAITIIALQWLMANHADLKQRWSAA